jgi:hypothetical protein
MPKSIPGAGQPGDRKRGPRSLAAASGRIPTPSRGPPVGEELVQPPRRESREEAEGVPEVDERVNPEPPAGPDHGVQDGHRLPAGVAPGEQVVLAADGDGPQALPLADFSGQNTIL